MNSKSRLMQNLSPSHNLMFGLIVVLSLCVQASAGDIKVRAYKGETGDGESGVVVTLRRCCGNSVALAMQSTDDDGICSFSRVGPGKYLLQFAKVGYQVIFKQGETTVASTGVRPPVQEVHVYDANEKATDALAISHYLKTRAQGDPDRYAKDVEALRQSGAVAADTIKTVQSEGKGPLPVGLSGNVAYSPESASVTVAADKWKEPKTFRVTTRTEFVDVQGRAVPPSTVKSDTPARFTLGQVGQQKVVTKVTVAGPEIASHEAR